MKKVLAVLLAVVMAFSVLAVCACAEEADNSFIVTEMSKINTKDGGEVAILKAGDVISYGELKAASKTVEIYYWPDAASIKASSVKNEDWKDVKMEKYSLDTSKWKLDAKKNEKPEDFMAKSPNYYKKFYAATTFEKGNEVAVTVLGMGEVTMAKDSANVDRGEVPIDFALQGGKFLGWVMESASYTKVTSNSDGKKTSTINLYALWDRNVETEDTKPTTPGFEEGDDPVVNAMNKVLYYIGIASGWVRAVPALLNAALAMFLDTGVRSWLYGIFGIEAKK